MKVRHARVVAAAWVGVLLALGPGTLRTARAQSVAGAVDDTRLAQLRRDWPDLYARLIGLERAHGVLYGALMRAKGSVGARGTRSTLDEDAVFAALVARRTGGPAVDRPDAEAERGFAALGPRAAAIFRRGHAFHREVLAIYAGVAPSARSAQLDEAVARYLSRADASLPDVPKDMTILYDHAFTAFTEDGFNPRRALTFPKLTGFVWAAHWFQLAAQEPFDVADDDEGRRAALRTVTERFERKLRPGTLPDAFPTELPLAPSIAPGLVTAHERAAAIIDNLNLLHDVIADILVHPKATNPRPAIADAIALFSDRRARIVDVDEWIKMALRHGIFEQGGPALMVMTQTDRNGSGHTQHTRGGRAIPPGGMR